MTMSIPKRNPITKGSAKKKDKKLLDWLKKGGRDGAKLDLISLIKKAVKPL